MPFHAWSGTRQVNLTSSPPEAMVGEPSTDTALSQREALELLALSEVIARKATYGRQLTVRAADRGCLVVTGRCCPGNDHAGRVGQSQPVD